MFGPIIARLVLGRSYDIQLWRWRRLVIAWRDDDHPHLVGLLGATLRQDLLLIRIHRRVLSAQRQRLHLAGVYEHQL